MMPGDIPERPGTWDEISLRDYFRQKNGRLTADDIQEIVERILSETDADRLSSLGFHLSHNLESQPQFLGSELLCRAWEQRTDYSRENNWEIRRVAWKIRLELERQRARRQDPTTLEALTERVCQSIRWDPQPKVLDELVDYPPLPATAHTGAEETPAGANFTTVNAGILECLEQSWRVRLEEARPEDEHGIWILRKGLETVRQKRTEHHPSPKPEI